MLNHKNSLDETNILESCTDWFFFLVLDIGNPEVSDIPVGTRIAIGLLQAIAVRAAGFSTITLAVLAPAVKWVLRSLKKSNEWIFERVLYVVMMYVSVCKYLVSFHFNPLTPPRSDRYEVSSLPFIGLDCNSSHFLVSVSTYMFTNGPIMMFSFRLHERIRGEITRDLRAYSRNRAWARRIARRNSNGCLGKVPWMARSQTACFWYDLGLLVSRMCMLTTYIRYVVACIRALFDMYHRGKSWLYNAWVAAHEFDREVRLKISGSHGLTSSPSVNHTMIPIIL